MASIPRYGAFYANGSHAGFISRAVAFVVDAFVVCAALLATALLVLLIEVFFLGGVVVAGRGPLHDAFAPVRAALTFAAVLFGVAFVVAYPIAFWVIAERTPGKALMGLRVVRTDGKAMTIRRAALRYVGYWVSALPLFLGFAWILIDDERRGWHDRIAGTCVVYTLQRQAPAERSRNAQAANTASSSKRPELNVHPSRKMTQVRSYQAQVCAFPGDSYPV